MRVAYALDDAFGGYFPDTLETLEALGAELVEFSPLRDGDLPPDVDLVLIGCGFPDRFAETLASNQCLHAALKSHVCQGRRIYSEGGGMAYLGRSMILPDGCVNGVGILPIDATLRPDWTPPTPVERTLYRDGWLGPRGTRVRGYRSGRWDLAPVEIDSHCRNCYGTLSEEGDVTFHHHAVGSLIHLHLGALPEVVSAFLGPHRPSLNLPRRGSSAEDDGPLIEPAARGCAAGASLARGSGALALDGGLDAPQLIADDRRPELLAEPRRGGAKPHPPGLAARRACRRSRRAGR